MYQLSLALDRKVTRKENAIAFRVREDSVREALKRILPFKPTVAQKTRPGRNRRGFGKARADESSAAGRRRQW